MSRNKENNSEQNGQEKPKKRCAGPGTGDEWQKVERNELN